MDQKIPKIIHYCWFGKNEKSDLIKKCIKSWKENCPDYKIIEWNEENFNVNINLYCEEAYKNKKWAFVSDYARLWILNEYGGVYFDTDVELIKKIDKLLVYDGFFCTEDGEYIATGLGMGSVKNNPFIKEMLNDYENIHFVSADNKLDLMPCPKRNTKSINRLIGDDLDFYENRLIKNNIFLTKEYFCPLDYESKKLTITDNTFAIHWYNESWLSPTKKIRKKILTVLRNVIGKDKYDKIKKKYKFNLYKKTQQ